MNRAGTRILLAIILGLCCAFTNRVTLAEPYVEHLDPPSVARGQRNRMVIVGTDVDRAIGLWTTLPPGKMKAGTPKSKGASRTEIEIEVTDDCPLGLYGLRLATQDGLSNLCLFLVDDIRPGTTLDVPQKTFPVSVSAELRPAATDRYSIEVTAGQRVAFDVVANRFGTDADPLVTIFDSAGRRVVQRDNDPGLFFDCCFEHKFAAAGIYTVEVRDSRFQGSPHWRYVLRMGNFPAARVAIPSAVRPGEKTMLHFPELADNGVEFEAPADQPFGGFFYSLRRPNDNAGNWIPLLATDLRNVVESEPNDLPEQSTVVGDTPVCLHGTLHPPGDRDQFLFDLKPGGKLIFRAETRPLNSAADVELILFDPTGKEVQRNDDLTLPGGVLEEATITYAAPKAGRYRLQVREVTEQGGPQFTYRVEVRPNLPRFQLSSVASAFTVPQQSYQRLSVSVVRTDYNGPIELTLADAPPGMRLEPNVIPEGTPTLNCKLFASADTPQGIYTFRITGRGQLNDAFLNSAVAVQPLVDRQLINVDLVKYALRDSQRWLPPSVTNRLALQITPPIPFTVELAESTVVLPRYQIAEVNIQTSRIIGFETPIELSAAGGQLGKESQGRRQVFGRFPVVLPNAPNQVATIHSRSQAQELKELVDVTATTKDGSRSITLVRSFLLDVRPAFAIKLEPTSVATTPGSSGVFKIAVERLGTFSGPVTIEPVMTPGITLPEKISIAAGQSSVDVEVAVAADFKPAKRKVRLPATAQVNGFQEEPRAIEIEIDVRPEAKPDKKP